VYGVYSPTPGDVSLPVAAATAPARPIRDVHAGPASIAAYTVVHGRDGEAAWGLAVCDVADGSGARAYARMEDPALLADAESVELVGASVDLVAGEGNVNVVKR
jgi:acetyl-CoA C-acetyltransferase